MKNTLKTVFAIALFVALTHSAVHAQTPALLSGSGASAKTYSGSVGFEFTLTNSETLEALGLLDVNSTDVGTQKVGLYSDSTGLLLASANVTISSMDVAGSFVYNTTPITYTLGFTGTLVAGTDYDIAYNSTTAAYTDDGLTSPTTSPGVTLLASRYSSDSGFAFPNNPDHTTAQANGGLAYTGPNFEFGPLTTAPEPTTYALLGLGALALVIVSRRATRNA